MTDISVVTSELKKLGSAIRARACLRYFKTGKGEYGYGDVFFGVRNADQRQVAKRYKDLALPEIKKLLQSKVHECRQTALFILVSQYKKADETGCGRIAKFYLSHTKRVNNWDLVDCSAPYILGQYFLGKDKSILYNLAQSENLWERRIAIMATIAFIKNGQYLDTFKIAKILLKDEQDLIHKAVGWMLREVGKKNLATEEEFLKKHGANMPRVMLRYAIEKFPETKRKEYLMKGKVNLLPKS